MTRASYFRVAAAVIFLSFAVGTFFSHAGIDSAPLDILVVTVIVGLSFAFFGRSSNVN